MRLDKQRAIKVTVIIALVSMFGTQVDSSSALTRGVGVFPDLWRSLFAALLRIFLYVFN